MAATPKNGNRYSRIIEKIFQNYYKEGAREITFERQDIERFAQELKIALPKNLGDLIYSFRYRADLPASIRSKAPEGSEWIIKPAGRSRYSFVLTKIDVMQPNSMLSETKVPDATPGIVAKYSFNDEQALLAKLRYNRLIDIFTGVTCYSLQNHLRTTVPAIGQVETDELYVGLDKKGAHYVFPVQAKGGTDSLTTVQIQQDFALCKAKFPSLVCRPIGAQFMGNDLICLFEFEEGETGVTISSEKHYRLVHPKEINDNDLLNYGSRT